MQARPNAEVLMRHSAWLRKLAWDLVGDAQRAEDVVQDTWVAALERPPQFGEDGPRLRAWLAQVTRNLAHMSRRSETRRAVRERSSARPEAQPSLQDSLERVALQREVVSAVMSLRSPDREIVVLRYFEGRKPAGIAEELGLSSSAVRSRLSRSLDVLRARLDGAQDGGRERWAPALAAWASPTASLLGGGLLKTAGKAALLAALAGLGWLGLRAARPAQHDVDATALAGDATDVLLPAAALASLDARPATQRRMLPAASETNVVDAPPSVSVQGRCVDLAGAALEGVRVSVRDSEPSVEARTGADGCFEVVLPWPPTPDWSEGQERVSFDFSAPALAADFATLFILEPTPHYLPDVTLAPGGNVVGRVVDEHGAALAGVRIDAIQPVADDPAARESAEVRIAFAVGKATARSSDDGSFLLEGVPATTVSLSGWAPFGSASERPYLNAVSRPVAVRAGATVDAGALVVRPADDARLIRCQVLDPEGRPAPDARVTARSSKRLRTGPSQTISGLPYDADGHFAVLVERGTEYALTAARSGWNEITVEGIVAGGHELVLQFAARTPAEVRLTLEPSGGVQGRVLAQGRPMSGVHVHAHLTDPSHDPREVHFERLGERRPEGASTDAAGEFFLPLAEGGTFALHAEHPDFARTRIGVLALQTGERVKAGDVNLVRGGRVEGRILTPLDVRAAGWHIGATAGDGHAEGAVVDLEGRFSFEHLTPGPWTLARFQRFSDNRTLHAEDKLPLELEPRLRVDVLESETLSVALDLRERESVTLRGFARLGGRAPHAATVTVAGAASIVGVTLDERGSFVTPLPAAGTYSVRIYQAPARNVRIDWGGSFDAGPLTAEWNCDLPCGTVEVTGLAQLERGATFELEWSDAAGRHWRARAQDAADDVLRLECVPAGALKCFLAGGASGASGITRAPVRELVLAEGGFAKLDL